MLRFGLVLFAVLIELAFAQPDGAAKRVALVIGNGAYAQAGTLANPVNEMVRPSGEGCGRVVKRIG